MVCVFKYIPEGTFIKGLRPELRSAVRVMQPEGLNQAMKLAIMIDDKKLNGVVGKSAPKPLTWGYNAGQIYNGLEMAEKHSKGICFRCDEKFTHGHTYASKTLQVLLVGDEEEDEDSDPEHVHLDSVEVSLNSVIGFTTPRIMKIKGILRDRYVVVLIDYGATHKFLSMELVNDLGLVVSGRGSMGVMLGNGKIENSYGLCKQVVLTLHELQVVDDFYPLELGSTDMILGIKWLQTLGDMTTLVLLKSMVRLLQKEKKGFLVKMKLLDDTQAEAVTTETSFDSAGLLAEYEDVLNLQSGLLPSRDHEHSIMLKDGTTLISVTPYRYPHIQKNEIKKLVKEMLAAGVIHPSSSPYSSPVLLVKKKDGSWRFCVDYRALNKEAMTQVHVLLFSTLPKPFIVKTDTSGSRVGAMLMQEGKPINYFSQVLVRTNQRSIKYLLEQRLVSEKHQKWLTKLMGYDLEIQYRPRKDNSAVDALSRRTKSVEYKALSMPSAYYWDELLRDVKRDTKLEPLRKRVLDEDGSCTGYTMERGRLLYMKRLVLPRTSQWIPKLFLEFHSSTTGGHEGHTKTYHRMASKIYWSEMRKDIARMVSECVVCQLQKYSTLALSGLLHPLELPEKVWDEVTMDFIDGLPKYGGFTIILVVVDCLSKYAHFVPLRHPYTASTLAAIFIWEVIRLHGVPKAMVTGQDKLRPYRHRSLSKRLNEKLDPRYFGPFEVLEKIGTVAYRLKLPDTASIHPVFHVSQLRKVVGDQVPETNFPKELTKDIEMRVQPQEVLGVREGKSNSKEDREVLIHWKSLPE
uniref:Putative mitochondrial protein n=1 Tax=Tanacetum cinerariifolium TaxID=118510 RepID=A0A6L2L3P9_TANCI|nr:putative mitochondrial protein [Tanacetum cinerariifolium]